MAKTWYEQGGAAFPTNTTNEQNSGACDADYGMSLRQYFAGKALQGMLASEGSEPQGAAGFYKPKDAAERAVEMADALIAELSK